MQEFDTIQQCTWEVYQLYTTAYRVNDHWRFVIQRLCFLASLLNYLESEKIGHQGEYGGTINFATYGQ
jgi:hypothetical protein